MSEERIFNKLEEIGRTVTQTSLDLTELRAEVMGTNGKGRLPALEDKVEATEGRITALERFRWLLVGGAAVVMWAVEQIFHKK